MVTQASASDPPFYGIFVPLKIKYASRVFPQGHQDVLQLLILKKKGALTLFLKKLVKYMNLQR